MYTVKDILPVEACNKLKKYINNIDDTQWQPTEEKFYKQNRRKITWDSDTIIEELHYSFEKITDNINKIFPNQQHHNFIGISLWEDTGGYNFNWHTDNELLSSALQIYLFDCPQNYGTTFNINNIEYALPFKHNTGYFIDQSVRPMLTHKTTSIVPDGIKRYSMYVSWSFTKKLIH